MNDGDHYLDETRRMQRMVKDEVKGVGEQIRRPTTIRERTQAGLLAARAGGRLGGKAHALDVEAGDALAYVKQLSGEALIHRAVELFGNGFSTG